MSYRSIAGSLLLLMVSQSGHGSWSLDSHSVALGSDEGGDYALITLRGGSSNSCIPLGAEGTIHHFAPATAEYNLVLPGPETGCFAAFRPWEYTVRLPDPILGLSYAVKISAGDEQIGNFDVVVTDADVSAVAKAATIGEFAPTQGIWWSSGNPGTGLALNIDTEGRWFGALYLYDEAGAPTFLTLQGTSLAYQLDGDGDDPYAIGISPLILSEGGQCLGCPWTQATTSDTGADAELIFYTATRATLKVGAWSLELTPLPMSYDEARIPAAPTVDEHYTLMLDAPSSGRHVAVVKVIPASPVAGQITVALECVDCRTVDDTGAASTGADDALETLIEEEIRFSCVAGRCTMSFHDTIGYPIVSKDGGRIDVLVNRIFGTPPPGTPDVGTTHIQLTRLADGWRD